MSSASQIKLGALMSYATLLFSIVAGLIYTPWMVHQIGKSDYGLYILVTSFLTYFVMDFGLGQTISRFIAKYRAEGNEAKVNEFLGLTTRLYLMIDLVIYIVLAVVFLFIEQIFTKLTPIELYHFKVVYVIAGFSSIVSFPFKPLDGILIAYERFVLLKFSDLLSKIGLIVFIVIALLLGYKLYALVAINAGVGIVIVIVKLYYLAKTTTIKINYRYYNKELFREIFNISSWMTVIIISQLLFLNITPAILAIYSGTHQIAIFAIGRTIAGYVWTFSDAINGLLLPRVSELSVKNEDTKEISNLMIRVGRIQFYIIWMLLVGILTLGKQFIMLWMGADFKDSYYVSILLVVALGVTATEQIGSTLILVVNRVKQQAILNIVSAVFSVIVSVLLAPRFGAIGSAVGIFSAMIFFNIIGMNILYWKILKLDIPRFFYECHLKLLIPLGLSLVAGLLIQTYIPAHNLLTFMPKAGLFLIAYVGFMWLLGMNESEKQLVYSAVGKLTRRS